ncbi:MAG: bifunctional folylpolyglutamate synthase/dihydrofolate synthase [Bacteroidales bacterium]|nr:bifunctional folylpolyglutamate synthase/dihydrofolate synthase [Bacteroidales bacterium]
MNNCDRYQSCLDYLYSQLPIYHRIGPAAYKADITDTVKLCAHFGNPQNGLKCIHVAGTNGKTSASHYIASVLQKAGYKTGLYTSPHLVDFRERILVDGEMIDKDYVCSFVENNKDLFKEIQPSFFEITVALAFCYFRDVNVDFAVIEVGLGGRLDSTNIITPLVSLITNIGFDHTQFLGNTLPEIAFEKAGIIKDNVPVVISETQPETKGVFLKKAAEEHAPICFADEDFVVKDVSQTMEKLEFKATSSKTGTEYNVHSKLIGHYEIKNIRAVLEVLEILGKQYPISHEAILEGLKSTVLRGRWDIIHRDPYVVCDTGHNAEGLTETLSMIGFVKYRKLRVVFGAVNDKKLDKTVLMFPHDAVYYFSQPSVPRAMDVDLLAGRFAEAGIFGRRYARCVEALEAALSEADNDDLIYVGGSTFVVADILKAALNNEINFK